MNGIILAGGKSSRFGENKAFVNIGRQFLIERTVGLLQKTFRQVYIVTNTPSEYARLCARLVTDIFKGCGPLGGLHAGLLASDSQHNFVVACDMPFLDGDLLSGLREEAEGYDLVVPKFGGKLQMLHAFYSKNCLPIIEEQLTAGNLKLGDLLTLVRSKIIEFENQGKPFMNINTQADYEEALAFVN